MSRTGKNSAGQVNVFNTFPEERLKYFVISTPEITSKKQQKKLATAK